MYVCVYDSLRHRRARAHAATIIITSPMRTLHDSTRAVDMREAVAACDPASLTARSSHPPRMITGHSAWQTEFRVVERGQTESYWFPECGERKSHEIARWERDPEAPQALAGHLQRETCTTPRGRRLLILLASWRAQLHSLSRLVGTGHAPAAACARAKFDSECGAVTSHGRWRSTCTSHMSIMLILELASPRL